MISLEKFLNALSYSNDEVSTYLSISSATLEKEKCLLTIEFFSEKPLSPEAIFSLSNHLDYNLLPGIKSQVYSFKFNSFDESDISKYYSAIIKKMSQNDSDILKALSYKIEYSRNELSVSVPEDDLSFSFHRYEILNSFKRYGFSINVKIVHVETENSNVISLIRESKENIISSSNKNLNKVEYRYLNKDSDLQGHWVSLKELPIDEESYDNFINNRNRPKTVLIKGYITFYDIEEFTKSGRVKFIITDGGNHYATLSLQSKAGKANFAFFSDMKRRMYVEVQCRPNMYNGYISYNIVNMKYRLDIPPITERVDSEENKRVELHLHTKMSPMDGVNDMEEYLEACGIFGHKGLAVTDHNGVQSFHELHDYAQKHEDFKPLFGVELNYVDEDQAVITTNEKDINLDDATYTAFDFETSGFSVNYETIIEIGAVKIHNGVIVDSFKEFVNPHKDVHPTVLELTNISAIDLKRARDLKDVLIDFEKFFRGTILVGHNVEFDLGHLYHNLTNLNISFEKLPSIDTLFLARVLNPNHKSYSLDHMCNMYDVTLDSHHRAYDDAKATGECLMKMINECKKLGINKHSELNSLIKEDERYKLLIPSHINLIAKTQKGLVNLYHIVSLASTDYYTIEPVLTKKVLETYREGILVGSGCRNSFFFDTAFRKSNEKLEEIIDFYDYIEVQPLNSFTTYDDHMYDAKYDLTDTIKRIIYLADKHGVPVVATGDVHQINKEDQLYRKIMVATDPSKGKHHYMFKEKNIPCEYYMTTREMLDEFSFLGEAKAYEIVVKNTNLIADSCEKIKAFSKTPYPPQDDFMAKNGIPSAEEFVKKEVVKKAAEVYGEMLPGMVFDRITNELDAICTNKFSTVYLISQLLVHKSVADGYVVGSRGSVGSSFVAYLMDITEVNSLPPHYICPRCHFSTFKMNAEEKNKYGIRADEEEFVETLDNVLDGYDLPDAYCPVCGEKLKRDGHDIPFETFLGVKEDPKTPDIDLNFSGENQSQIHEYIRELFGQTKAFRAGTILTSKDKTSYAIVKDYFELENEKRIKEGLEPISHTGNEIESYAAQITGSKKSSSQHPGGIVVVPEDHEIYEITPVQYPGEAKDRNWMTTHFDYHQFEKNLFKLDVLGQDDPTVLKYLMEFVKKNPSHFPFKDVKDIPVDDPKIYSLMCGTEALGVTPDEISTKIASYGISEFGTKTVRAILEETRPKTFSELLKISGLSHGTDVWAGNSQVLLNPPLGFKYPKMEFKKLIGCRDDIMLDLISFGVPSGLAFKTMEFVRKGNPCKFPQKWQDLLETLSPYKIPEWFLWSCSLIQYMFPKAHAAAYTIMALRIAWFKVYRPIYFYSAILSKKKDKFDIETLLSDQIENKKKIEELRSLSKDDQDSNTKDLLTCAELALEMKARGLKFLNIDLYKSGAKDFTISDDESSMYLPFESITGLGETVALNIVREREIRPFDTKKDFQERTKATKTNMNSLEELGVFKDLPDDDQEAFDFTSLFE